MPKSQSFKFDGGAATYMGTLLLSVIITLLTLGLAYPYGLVLRQRWRAKHTFVNGVQLVFFGKGIGLFGLWIKWWLLTVITLGIYSFWVIPRLNRWIVEHTEFDSRVALPSTFQIGSVTYCPQGSVPRVALPFTEQPFGELQ